MGEQKFNFWENKNLIFGTEKFIGPKKIWEKKIGIKKFGGQKIFGSQKFLGQKEFRDRNFWCWKNLSQKKFWVQKIFRSKNDFWLKFFWYKKFGSRFSLVLLGLTLELAYPPQENSRVKGLIYHESYRFLSVKIACKVWDS